MGLRLVITQSNLTLFGGAEKVLLKIAQHYDAKIYTAEYNPATTFPEFKALDVEVIGSKAIGSVMPYGRVSQGLNYGLSFYKLKIPDDYDVINAHMSPGHWARNRNERMLWYCHTPPRDIYDLYRFRLSMKKFYQRPVYAMGAASVRHMDQGIVRNIEFIFANSHNTRSRIERYYKRDDAVVLNGGIDYEEYEHGDDGKYFIYPSRFSPNKRQEYAIRAFQMFKRDKKGYKLLLCGAVSKDRQFQEYYSKIRELAKEVGDVKFIENASDKKLHALYAESTAVLYPPINEDYGLVPMEAMASRKPIIAVNEGGPRDTIREGITGFLVGSEREMAERMRFVTEHPITSKEMGKNGLHEVKNKYSWKEFFAVFDRKAREVARGAHSF